MNQRELNELRRRFHPDRCAVSHIYGCYVNTERSVIAYVDAPMGVMPQEETEKYMSLLKKSMSGSLGRNLIDIAFSNEQVIESEEHRLLSALRSSALKDPDVREAFYRKVIGSVDMGMNYLILLAHDSYDVPYRGKDGENSADASDSVYSYIICCICPVKDGKPELGYFPGDREFHSRSAAQVVSAPELGFLFPAFDDRAANIYNALFYTKKTDVVHTEFINAVFHTEPPMSAAEQKDAFQSALCGALDDTCSIDVVQAVHEQLRGKIEQHKESRDPEPLTLTASEVADILRDCGVDGEHADAFCEKCTKEFGPDAPLSPANIIDTKRYEVKTPDVSINVSPENSYLIETRIINGRKYILIPADSGVEVNGMSVSITPDGQN